MKTYFELKKRGNFAARSDEGSQWKRMSRCMMRNIARRSTVLTSNKSFSSSCLIFRQNGGNSRSSPRASHPKRTARMGTSSPRQSSSRAISRPFGPTMRDWLAICQVYGEFLVRVEWVMFFTSVGKWSGNRVVGCDSMGWRSKGRFGESCCLTIAREEREGFTWPVICCNASLWLRGGHNSAGSCDTLYLFGGRGGGFWVCQLRFLTLVGNGRGLG